MVDLEPGDFLYQADQELFLVCMEDRDDEVEFAVHGWRTIDKARLDSYLDADKPVIHTEKEVRNAVADADDPKAGDRLAWLTDIFEKYENVDVEDDSVHSDFALDDT